MFPRPAAHRHHERELRHREPHRNATPADARPASGSAAPARRSSADHPRWPGGPMPRKDWNETVIRVGNGRRASTSRPITRRYGSPTLRTAPSPSSTSPSRRSSRPSGRMQWRKPAQVHARRQAGAGLHTRRPGSRHPGCRHATQHQAPSHRPRLGRHRVEPSGARAFVACSPDNYVAVIDLNSLGVSGHIQAGGEPDGMDWAIRR